MNEDECWGDAFCHTIKNQISVESFFLIYCRFHLVNLRVVI